MQLLDTQTQPAVIIMLRRHRPSMVTTRRGALQRMHDQENLHTIASRLKELPATQHAPVSNRFAAVLVPLFEDPSNGEVNVWLTQRSTNLSSHSGVYQRSVSSCC